MQRWNIINQLIKKNNYKSYLEIGYYKGWSFDQVKCDYKCAVDPNPCKTEEQQKLEAGSYITPYSSLEEGVGIIYKMTSDEFFGMIHGGTGFDLVFIDGLHVADQVQQDIENSLKHLNDGGAIVIHDCNPPTYEHTTTGVNGCWTGDTYKALVKWRLRNPEYESYTVDTDWGCGVITRNIEYLDNLDLSDRDVSKQIEWSFFDKNRKELLNLISIEEFLKRNLVTTNLPGIDTGKVIPSDPEYIKENQCKES